MVALGLILSGIFIRDPLHTLSSFIAFLALVGCFGVFAWRFARDPRWKGWPIPTILAAVLLMSLLAMYGAARAGGGPAGLFERMAVLDRSLWSLVFTIRLLMGVRLTAV